MHRTVDEASLALKGIQEAISSGCTPLLLQQEATAYTNLAAALSCQGKYLKQKSRLRWLKEGDRSSRYFHVCAQLKVARANIASLVEGFEVITAPSDIENCVLNYYKSFYTSAISNGGGSYLLNFICSLVSDSDNAMLTAVPSYEEIKQAVFDLNASSAAGLNGFNRFFFHHCCLIVQKDVCAVVQVFF